ncbi:MAG: OsmC family protein [Acetobacterium sp.]
MPNLKFNVKAKSENCTKTVIEARGFTMIIDEPADLGGKDEAANPLEYVLAALAGCLNVVGHVIAKEMGFTLRGLEIDLEGDLEPSKFLGLCDDGRSGYTDIQVTIKPDTDADPATLAKWVKAVECRCPVTDNIKNATPLTVSLA